jgi:AcrR family transcriptional regulator
MQLWAPPQPLGRLRKGDRTRERLFQAAVDEFRSAGFEQASVGRIAARAGTSRAAFYFHFPCREAVLLDLQWRMECRIVERTRAQATLRGFLTELVDALVVEQESVVPDDLMRAMLSVYIRPPAGLDLSDQPFPLMNEVGRRFTQTRERELRAGLEPAQATDLFLTSLFGALVRWRGPLASRRDDLLQLAALYLRDAEDAPPA